MKRKIAAIFAADIAGYSRLVAEDEEETLRRLAAYRAVVDDFIAKAGGRIFNTAGDAVLAEFSSAVEAVRCAIDIQESLRTRNMAYPPSRQMSFRIGITIGDVVERDGDLLGDGVNIAARLEGLAEVGGICVSRAVHEQVANKLSVQFADIGAQEVKNIPTPVHAYMIAMRREDGSYSTPQVKKVAKQASSSSWMWPVAVMVICLAAIGAGAFLYFTQLELGASKGARAAKDAVAKVVAATTPAASPVPSPAAPPSPAPQAAIQPAPLPSRPLAATDKFIPDIVPFIGDRVRASLASEYVTGGDFKAFALNSNGISGFVVGQPSEDDARKAALDLCKKRADAANAPRACELYAVGGTTVFAHGLPPMPPQPWVRRDAAVERVFVPKDIPLVRDRGRDRLDTVYMTNHKPRAVALGPGGQFAFYFGETDEEAERRSLESCAAISGVTCMVIAVEDNFVVPVPATMRATGFFQSASNTSIASDARDNVTRRLADASGWTAVAVGAAGRPGLGLEAPNEQTAINP